MTGSFRLMPLAGASLSIAPPRTTGHHQIM